MRSSILFFPFLALAPAALAVESEGCLTRGMRLLRRSGVPFTHIASTDPSLPIDDALFNFDTYAHATPHGMGLDAVQTDRMAAAACKVAGAFGGARTDSPSDVLFAESAGEGRAPYEDADYVPDNTGYVNFETGQVGSELPLGRGRLTHDGRERATPEEVSDVLLGGYEAREKLMGMLEDRVLAGTEAINRFTGERASAASIREMNMDMSESDPDHGGGDVLTSAKWGAGGDALHEHEIEKNAGSSGGSSGSSSGSSGGSSGSSSGSGLEGWSSSASESGMSAFMSSLSSAIFLFAKLHFTLPIPAFPPAHIGVAAAADAIAGADIRYVSGAIQEQVGLQFPPVKPVVKVFLKLGQTLRVKGKSSKEGVPMLFASLFLVNGLYTTMSSTSLMREVLEDATNGMARALGSAGTPVRPSKVLSLYTEGFEQEYVELLSDEWEYVTSGATRTAASSRLPSDAVILDAIKRIDAMLETVPKKSGDGSLVYIYTASSTWFSTKLHYRVSKRGTWSWSPDGRNWMPVTTITVRGGRWNGEKPTSNNIATIRALNLIYHRFASIFNERRKAAQASAARKSGGGDAGADTYSEMCSGIDGQCIDPKAEPCNAGGVAFRTGLCPGTLKCCAPRALSNGRLTPDGAPEYEAEDLASMQSSLAVADTDAGDVVVPNVDDVGDAGDAGDFGDLGDLGDELVEAEDGDGFFEWGSEKLDEISEAIVKRARAGVRRLQNNWRSIKKTVQETGAYRFAKRSWFKGSKKPMRVFRGLADRMAAEGFGPDDNRLERTLFSADAMVFRDFTRVLSMRESLFAFARKNAGASGVVKHLRELLENDETFRKSTTKGGGVEKNMFSRDTEKGKGPSSGFQGSEEGIRKANVERELSSKETDGGSERLDEADARELYALLAGEVTDRFEHIRSLATLIANRLKKLGDPTWSSLSGKQRDEYRRYFYQLRNSATSLHRILVQINTGDGWLKRGALKSISWMHRKGDAGLRYLSRVSRSMLEFFNCKAYSYYFLDVGFGVALDVPKMPKVGHTKAEIMYSPALLGHGSVFATRALDNPDYTYASMYHGTAWEIEGEVGEPLSMLYERERRVFHSPRYCYSRYGKEGKCTEVFTFAFANIPKIPGVSQFALVQALRALTIGTTAITGINKEAENVADFIKSILPSDDPNKEPIKAKAVYRVLINYVPTLLLLGVSKAAGGNFGVATMRYDFTNEGLGGIDSWFVQPFVMRHWGAPVFLRKLTENLHHAHVELVAEAGPVLWLTKNGVKSVFNQHRGIASSSASSSGYASGSSGTYNGEEDTSPSEDEGNSESFLDVPQDK